MPNLWARIFAFFLVICLAIDPITAANLSASYLRNQKNSFAYAQNSITHLTVFTQEALTPAGLMAYLRTFDLSDRIRRIQEIIPYLHRPSIQNLAVHVLTSNIHARIRQKNSEWDLSQRVEEIRLQLGQVIENVLSAPFTPQQLEQIIQDVVVAPEEEAERIKNIRSWKDFWEFLKDHFNERPSDWILRVIGLFMTKVLFGFSETYWHRQFNVWSPVKLALPKEDSFLDAAKGYTKALCNGESLAEHSSALVNMGVWTVTSGRGALFIGSVQGKSITASFEGAQAGTKFEIEAHYIDPADPEAGVYLAVRHDKKTSYLQFKTSGTMLQKFRSMEEMVAARHRDPAQAEREKEMKLAVMTYIRALLVGMDVSDASKKLVDLGKRDIITVPNLIYFGTLSKEKIGDKLVQKMVQANVEGVAKGTQVSAEARYFDPEHPEQGVYLITYVGQKSFYYRFKSGGNHTEKFSSLEDLKLSLVRDPRAVIDEEVMRTAVSSYVTALLDDQDLRVLGRELVAAGPRTLKVGSANIHLGKVRGDSIAANYKHAEGAQVEVQAHFLNPESSGGEVYLTVRRGDNLAYFSFKKDGNHTSKYSSLKVLRADLGRAPEAVQEENAIQKAISEYVDAMRQGLNLGHAARAVVELKKNKVLAIKDHVPFGKVAGKQIYGKVDGLTTEDLVELEAHYLDLEDPSQGIYVGVRKGEKTNYFTFKTTGNYATKYMPPGTQTDSENPGPNPTELEAEAAMRDAVGTYASDLLNGRDFGLSAHALVDLGRKAMWTRRGTLLLGIPVDSQPIRASIPDVAGHARVDVSAHYIDPEDPLAGVYLLIQNEEFAYYARFRKTGVMGALRPSLETMLEEWSKEKIKAERAAAKATGERQGPVRLQKESNMQPGPGPSMDKLRHQAQAARAEVSEESLQEALFKRAIEKYVTVLINGEDLSHTAQTVLSLGSSVLKTRKDSLPLGAIDQTAYILAPLADSPAGTLVQVQAHLVDAANPGSGIYLSVTKDGALHYYGIKTDGAFTQKYPSLEALLTDSLRPAAEVAEEVALRKTIGAYATAFLNDGDLIEAGKNLVGMGKKTILSVRNRVNLGHANENDIIFASMSGTDKGTRLEVEASFLDPSAPGEGIYLTIQQGGQRHYFLFHSGGGHLRKYPTLEILQRARDQDSSVAQAERQMRLAVTAYANAFIEGQDIETAGKALVELGRKAMKTRKNLLHLGRTKDGKDIAAAMYPVDEETTAGVEAQFLDPSDPAQGVYLVTHEGETLRYYRFKKDGSPLEKFSTLEALKIELRKKPDEMAGFQEMKNALLTYILALKEGQDRSAAARALVDLGEKSAYTTGGRRVLFNATQSITIEASTNDLESGTRVRVRFHFLDASNPGRGAYMTMQHGATVYYYSLEKDGIHTRKYPNLEALLIEQSKDAAEAKGESEFRKAAENYIQDLTGGTISHASAEAFVGLGKRVMRSNKGMLYIGTIAGRSTTAVVPAVAPNTALEVQAHYINPLDSGAGIYLVVSEGKRSNFYDIRNEGGYIFKYSSLDELRAERARDPHEVTAQRTLREAVHGYVKALAEGKDLRASSKALVELGKKPGRTSMPGLTFGKAEGVNLAIIASLHTVPVGSQVEVQAHYLNPQNPKEGVYLEIWDGTMSHYYRFRIDGLHTTKYSSLQELLAAPILTTNDLSEERTMKEAITAYAQTLDEGKSLDTPSRCLVEVGSRPMWVKSGNIHFGMSEKRAVSLGIRDIPDGTRVEIQAYYINGSKPEAGTYLIVRYGSESLYYGFQKEGNHIRKFASLEQLMATYQRDTGEAEGEAAMYKTLSDYLKVHAEGKPLGEAAQALVELGAKPMWTRENALHLGSVTRRSVSAYLGEIPWGTRVMVHAQYLNPGNPDGGVYLVVAAEGKEFYFRFKPGSAKLEKFDSKENLLSGQSSSGRSSKKKTDYERALETFEKYHLLDLAVSLASNPEEMREALSLLLAAQGAELPEADFRRMSRAFLLNLREGHRPAGMGNVQPGDPMDYLRALMALQEEIARMEEHEQRVLIRAFVRLSFARFARDTKVALTELRTLLKSVKSTPFLQELTGHVQRMLVEGLKYQPAHIRTPLLPHQRVGSWYMRKSDQFQAEGLYGFMLEDDTRLGKTIQTYAALDPNWKSLIVMPAGVMDTWEEQYYRHTTGASRLVVLRGTVEQKRRMIAETRDQKGVIILCSLEDLRGKTAQEFDDLNKGLDVVVVDEAQRIENYKGRVLKGNAQQAQAVHQLHTPRRWLLSASPYTSHPRQLFSAFNLLHKNPATGEVSNALFATRQSFRRLLTGTLKQMRWLYALKARIGLRRTKKEMGSAYTTKHEIAPSEEGAYVLPKAQSYLILSIIKNLKDYLTIYNQRVPPEKRYPESSLGVLLKMQFLSWAMTDPSLIGDEESKAFWDALDARVLPRVENGKKGILFAQNTNLINKMAAWYEAKGYKVARIDGTVTGNAMDEKGQPILVKFDKDGKMALDPEGHPISAQAYQRHRFQEDPEVQLVVMNIQAGLGLNLSAADFEVYVQLPENYVEYYQSSDRAIGLNEGTTGETQKKVEVLWMMPQHSAEFLEEMRGTDDFAYVEHGTPAEICYAQIMGEDKAQFELVMEGIEDEGETSPEASMSRLVNAIHGFLQDPSMKKAGKRAQKMIRASNVLYPAYGRMKESKASQEEILRLVNNFSRTDVSPVALGKVLGQAGHWEAADIAFFNALFNIPNKQHRDQMLQVLPEVCQMMAEHGLNFSTLAKRGPPPLQILAETQPELFIPFVAASHAWRIAPDNDNVLQPIHPGAQVLLHILEEFYNDGFSVYDREQWIKRLTYAWVNLMDLSGGESLVFLGALREDFLDEGVSIPDRIEFLEELGVLRTANAAAFERIVKQGVNFSAVRQDLRDTLRGTVIQLFDLPDTAVTHERLLALSREWGNLNAPLQLMAKLREGNPAEYGEHVALFKQIMRHIVAGDYEVWRNRQVLDGTAHDIAYRSDDPQFWTTFTKEELVALGSVQVGGAEYEEDRRNNEQILLDRLQDKEALREAFGELGTQMQEDLSKTDAASLLSQEIADKGRQRQALETARRVKDPGDAIGILNLAIQQLRLRLCVIELRAALQANEIDKLPKLLGQVMGAVQTPASSEEMGLHLAVTIRQLQENLAQAGKIRQFDDVEVEITSNPDLIMRRGMLHEELKNCFNLNAGVRQIATLVDDLASKNKMLAIVRSEGRIVSVAMLKVRQTDDGAPVIMIERPLYRWGYNFEKEIAQAVAQTKLPGMPGTLVAGDLYKGVKKGRQITVSPTGARGPTEYHETLFGWRIRRSKVQHIAGVMVEASGMQEALLKQEQHKTPSMGFLGGIGYQKLPIEEFIERLKSQNVDLVVDVRELAVSQWRPEYSRENLESALIAAGIEYLHMPELGAPKALRNSHIAGKNDAEFIATYEKYLREHLNVLKNILPRLEGRRATLLCLEADPYQCHRLAILKELAELVNVAEPIIDLRQDSLFPLVEQPGPKSPFTTDVARAAALRAGIISEYGIGWFAGSFELPLMNSLVLFINEHHPENKSEVIKLAVGFIGFWLSTFAMPFTLFHLMPRASESQTALAMAISILSWLLTYQPVLIFVHRMTDMISIAFQQFMDLIHRNIQNHRLLFAA